MVAQNVKRSEDGAPIRALIVGAGVAGAMVSQEMVERPEGGYVVVGFLDDDPTKTGTTVSGAPVLGRVADLVDVVASRGVDEIVIAIPSARGRTVRDVVRLCEEAGKARVDQISAGEARAGEAGSRAPHALNRRTSARRKAS